MSNLELVFWARSSNNPSRRNVRVGFAERGRLTAYLLGMLLFVWDCPVGDAQSPSKPIRVEAPVFQPGQFDDVFFENAAGLLKGELPSKDVIDRLPEDRLPKGSHADIASAMHSTASTKEQSGAWNKLISPNSLEDLIKASKLRLDKILTTPAAFKGGGYSQARAEFSLQAVLFAIIESYDGEVRWKNSAATARERFARVAANTKVGAEQVFQEAKLRLLDLGDLIGGAALTDPARSEIDWSQLIDRGPLMQLLAWAQEENLIKLVANEVEFNSNPDAVQRYSELIAILGKIVISEDMPDAADRDYIEFSNRMLSRAQQVAAAVRSGNADMARTAAAGIGQACSNCHHEFR